MDGPEVDALAAQLRDLVNLVRELSDGEFSLPTRCPGWRVAELVAHCEGILLRLVGENAEPVDGEAEIDRVGYYRYDPDGPREGGDPERTFSEIVRDRVIDEAAGRAPRDLRSSLEEAVEAAISGIGEVPADRVIHRSGHPRIGFGEFVASRNLEFAVHTMDVADAVGRPERINPATGSFVVGILNGLLGEPLPPDVSWDDSTFALVATGRVEMQDTDRLELGVLAARFPLLR